MENNWKTKGTGKPPKNLAKKAKSNQTLWTKNGNGRWKIRYRRQVCGRWAPARNVDGYIKIDREAFALAGCRVFRDCGQNNLITAY